MARVARERGRVHLQPRWTRPGALLWVVLGPPLRCHARTPPPRDLRDHAIRTGGGMRQGHSDRAPCPLEVGSTQGCRTSGPGLAGLPFLPSHGSLHSSGGGGVRRGLCRRCRDCHGCQAPVLTFSESPHAVSGAQRAGHSGRSQEGGVWGSDLWPGAGYSWDIRGLLVSGDTACRWATSRWRVVCPRWKGPGEVWDGDRHSGLQLGPPVPQSPRTRPPSTALQWGLCLTCTCWALAGRGVNPAPSAPHSNRVTGVYELSLCHVADAGSPGRPLPAAGGGHPVRSREPGSPGVTRVASAQLPFRGRLPSETQVLAFGL